MEIKYVMPIMGLSIGEKLQLQSLKEDVRLSGLSNSAIDILYNRPTCVFF